MFGELVDVQLPLDYETGNHRGFAFLEYELAEDAADAMDNMVSCYIIYLCFIFNFFKDICDNIWQENNK